MAATTPRKAAPRKPSAAVAARREVRAEKGKPAPLSIRLRGETFEIPRDRIGNDRTYNLTVAMQAASEPADRIVYMGRLVRYLIGPTDMDRWIGLSKDDEMPGALVVETMQAINKAGNVPNS